MTLWSKHVHRYAKRNKLSYKEAQENTDCKEKYKKKINKTSPKPSPRRRKMSWAWYKTNGGKKDKHEEYVDILGEYYLPRQLETLIKDEKELESQLEVLRESIRQLEDQIKEKDNEERPGVYFPLEDQIEEDNEERPWLKPNF